MPCRVGRYLGTLQTPLHKCPVASEVTKAEFCKLRKELELSIEEEATVAKNSFQDRAL